MDDVVQRLEIKLREHSLAFTEKPLVVGGMAMEYYGLRKAGADIDLVIVDADYQALACRYPDRRKDIYGDLGVVIGEFEIWRSIALLDYPFLVQGSEETASCRIVSIDRLLLMRVCAMDVPKYKTDLLLVKEYYYRHYRNTAFLSEAQTHIPTYERNKGIVFAGEYADY